MQNNWGGPSSADKRDWFGGAIVEMFPSFVDLAKPQQPQPQSKTSTAAPPPPLLEEPEIEDIETTLLQVMVDEFEVNVDDDSGFESAETIMRVRAQCAKGDFTEVNDLQRRWEAGRGKKVAAVQAPDADQDTDWESSDDDNDEEGGDVEMDEAPALVPIPKEKPPPEVDEEGFTKVTKKKR